MADRRVPTPESLEVARLIKNRVGAREGAPLRTAFVGSVESVLYGPEVPPLARLLRAGRSGDVRLKLELSFLWLAVRPPHDLELPNRVWAQLLDLTDPEGLGTRRIRQAIGALAEERLVDIEPRAGQPNRILLLDEGGSGRPYTIPGKAYNQARGKGDEWRHRYIRVPEALWTNGWLPVLSAPALAMLLVLLAELGGRDAEDTELWLSPTVANRTFKLSDDTRSKGLRELQDRGIIEVRRRAAGRDVLDFRRMRNTHRLLLERLDEGQPS